MDLALPLPTPNSERRDLFPQSQEAIETMYLDPLVFQSARARRSRGRISLTPRVFQSIITQVSQGVAPVVACQAAGIAASTFNSWMKKGESFSEISFDSDSNPNPNSDNDLRDPANRLYRQFFLAIRQAEAQSEITLTQRFERATETSWQATASFLSKRFPERWSETQSSRSSQSQQSQQSSATQQATVICNVQFVKEILKDNKLSNMAETLLIEASRQLDALTEPQSQLQSSKDIIDVPFKSVDITNSQE